MPCMHWRYPGHVRSKQSWWRWCAGDVRSTIAAPATSISAAFTKPAVSAAPATICATFAFPSPKPTSSAGTTPTAAVLRLLCNAGR